jgi:hypothetical protein
MMIIAGGRSMESLYMVPALVQLARFPNVVVVPVCSARQQILSDPVKPGRPTDYLPRLQPTDVLYACGAPGMVDSIKSIAERAGAVCYADPFLPSGDDTVEDGVLTRAMEWLAVPARPQMAELALPSIDDDTVEESVPTRATRWLAAPPGRQMDQFALDRRRNRRQQPIPDDTVEERTPTRATRWLVDRPRNRREQPVPDDTIEERIPTRATRWPAVRPGRTGPVDLDRVRNSRRDEMVEESVPTRDMGWRAAPTERQMGQLAFDRPRNRREQRTQANRR